MYTVTLRGFHERETREAFHIDDLGSYDSMLKADAKALYFAKAIDFAAAAMCEQHNCDGLFVDVRSTDDYDAITYEVMPGRKMVLWWGNDCDV